MPVVRAQDNLVEAFQAAQKPNTDQNLLANLAEYVKGLTGTAGLQGLKTSAGQDIVCAQLPDDPAGFYRCNVTDDDTDDEGGVTFADEDDVRRSKTSRRSKKYTYDYDEDEETKPRGILKHREHKEGRTTTVTTRTTADGRKIVKTVTHHDDDDDDDSGSKQTNRGPPRFDEAPILQDTRANVPRELLQYVKSTAAPDVREIYEPRYEPGYEIPPVMRAGRQPMLEPPPQLLYEPEIPPMPRAMRQPIYGPPPQPMFEPMYEPVYEPDYGQMPMYDPYMRPPFDVLQPPPMFVPY